MTLFDPTDSLLQPLFDEPAARRTDPATSHEAAARVNPAGTRARALLALNASGHRGLTDFERAARTGLGQTSVGKRRLDLLRAGMVEPTGERRPSPTGTPALVFRITETGAREARRVASEREA